VLRLILLLSLFLGACISEAQVDFSEIDSLATVIENQSGIEKAQSQRRLSHAYYTKSIYQQALEHALYALDYYEEHELDSQAISVHTIIGAIYERTKKFERAEEHYVIALKGAKKYNDDVSVLAIYLNLGVLFSNSDQYEKSVQYSYLAIDKSKEIGDTLSLVRIYSNLSWSHFLNDEYAKSITAIDTGLYIVDFCPQTDGYRYREYSLKLNLSENYVKLGRNTEALGLLRELLDNIEIMSLTSAVDIYRLLATVHESNEDYDLALKFYKMEKLFLDSLTKAINNQQLMELTVQNELKYKQQESELLLKKKELKISAQRNKNNILTLGLLSLGIMLFIFINFYFRTRRKNKQLVEANLQMLANQAKKPHQRELKREFKKSTELSEEQKQLILTALNQAFNEEEVFKDENLTVNSLAKSLNTNRNYLTIVVKELEPSGFLDFVNEYRIRKSWTLLSNPEYFSLTIEHISKEVGFKSQPTFNKAFKKFTGVTPSFYLKEVKNKTANS
jgi:AraC-like DNA-binding protein